jgi:hypothetical protein
MHAFIHSLGSSEVVIASFDDIGSDTDRARAHRAPALTHPNPPRDRWLQEPWVPALAHDGSRAEHAHVVFGRLRRHPGIAASSSDHHDVVIRAPRRRLRQARRHDRHTMMSSPAYDDVVIREHYVAIPRPRRHGRTITTSSSPTTTSWSDHHDVIIRDHDVMVAPPRHRHPRPRRHGRTTTTSSSLTATSCSRHHEGRPVPSPPFPLSPVA